MKNPIIKSDLFKTPTSIEQLMEIAESMTNSKEAWMVMVFTLNYCHLMVEEEIKSAQRIRVVSKDKQDPWAHDPEAEEDRIAYEREQLMRP
jgi:hypothetical protein